MNALALLGKPSFWLGLVLAVLGLFFAFGGVVSEAPVQGVRNVVYPWQMVIVGVVLAVGGCALIWNAFRHASE